jgi:hypothetical protein
MRLKKLAIAVEAIAIPVLGVGIGIEAASGAETGYIVISIGACLVALGGFIWAKVLRR